MDIVPILLMISPTSPQKSNSIMQFSLFQLYYADMISHNRTADREYEFLDRLEAGMVLSGSEAKSIRTRGIKLEDAFVKIVAGEVRLLNASIEPYSFAPDENYDAKRTRKLLLNKKEIIKLTTKLNQSPQQTIIPLKCYLQKGRFKVEIALAKGKKGWQQKRVEKDRTIKRNVDKDLRDAVKV